MAIFTFDDVLSTITLTRSRRWAARGGLAILDQALFSGTTFVVNLALARWLDPAAYGAFAVAFGVFLFVAGFHNAVLLEPLSVLGPAEFADRLPSYFSALRKIHFAIAAILSIALLVAAGFFFWISPGGSLGPTLVATALACPLVLFLWLVRRFLYVLRSPAGALLGSGSYLVFTVGALVVIHRLNLVSPTTGFLALGAASAGAGACLLALPLLRRPRVPNLEQRLPALFGDHWRYGKWIVGSAVLSPVAAQAQTFFSAGLIGLGATGALRAMQTPMLLIAQSITAISTLGLPALSFDFGRRDLASLRRKGAILTVSLTAGALAYECALLLLNAPIERLLYGGKFAKDAWLIPLLGLVPIFVGLSAGYSLVLRAIQKPKFHLIATAGSVPVALVSAVLFTYRWGIAGAAASLVVTSAASATLSWYFYREWARSL